MWMCKRRSFYVLGGYPEFRIKMELRRGWEP